MYEDKSMFGIIKAGFHMPDNCTARNAKVAV